MRPRLIFCVFAAISLPAQAVTHVVNVGPGMTFAPATVTIHPGDRISFRNKGGLHNVTANDHSFRCAHGCDGDGHGGNGAPTTELFVVSVQFDQPGSTVDYFCEEHGTPTTGMRGKIIVDTSPVELQEFSVD
jgi:plastocyanin